MPSFEKDFINAKGKPIKYKDWELVAVDRIPVQKKFSGTLKIISTNSEWRQAVRFRVNGKLIINSSEGNNFITWEDDLKDNVLHFEGTAKDSQLAVYNAWESCDWMGNKHTDSWLNGAAMIVETNGNTRRYKCNDGHPDDNFDDIIFEVTIGE